MEMMGSVTIREHVTTGYKWQETTYTDEQIRDLFDDSADTLVIALLNRAVAAEEENERLRAALIEQAELWEMARPQMNFADAKTFSVPFMGLHEPDKKAREAADAAGGE